MIACVFDTETSGLIPNSLLPLAQQPYITEFYGALVDLQSGKIIEELEFLCKIPIKLEPIITKITGLTDEMLESEQEYAAYDDEVRRFFGQTDAEAVIAHNISFDIGMVENETRRCGTHREFRWPKRRICTVEQTEWIKGHRLNLASLHTELFGESFPEAHRAKNDVSALIRCSSELYTRGDL